MHQFVQTEQCYITTRSANPYSRLTTKEVLGRACRMSSLTQVSYWTHHQNLLQTTHYK